MFRKIASWFRSGEDLGAVSGTFHEGAWLSGTAVLHKEAALSGEVWWDRPVGWTGVAHSEARVYPTAASSVVLHSDTRVPPEAWEEER